VRQPMMHATYFNSASVTLQIRVERDLGRWRRAQTPDPNSETLL